MKNKNTEYGMTKEENDELSERNYKEWKKEKEEEKMVSEHSIKTDTYYRGWFEIDRERIEKNIVGRKLSEDEWEDLCWDLDEMSEGERENRMMEDTDYGVEYI